MTALMFFRPLFQRHAGRFLAALVLSLVTLAAGAALLGISGWFLTAAALTTAAAAFNLFGPSSAIRGLSLLRISARYGEKLVGHDATLRVLADIREWLFVRLLPDVPGAGRGLRHGDRVSRLTADVDALDSAFLVAVGPVVTGLIMAAALSLVLFLVIPPAGLVYAGAMAFALLGVPALLILASRRTGAVVVAASADARCAVLDGIEGHLDVVAFGEVATVRSELAAAAGRLGRARQRLGASAAVASAAVQTLAGVAMLGVLVFGIEALRAGAVGGPLLIGLLLAVLGSFEAAASIVRSIAQLGTAMAAASRLRTLGTAVAAVQDPVRPHPLPAGADVYFCGVRYGHEANRPVLRDVSLGLAAGERVAIVGESGSGKSTLLALLLRLADADAGSIRIAGCDISKVAQADLHARVALLEQNAPIFLGSIRDNLSIGRAGAGEGALWDVLKKARIDDFVRGLPAGLDTALGEAGKTLSAGQARRLCLARTLLSPAKILALDEPTSGLDRETELAFLRDLGPATAGRTVLLATHAALPDGVVDRTLRLRGGKLAEPGLVVQIG